MRLQHFTTLFVLWQGYYWEKWDVWGNEIESTVEVMSL
jgi:hypothetical protein